MSYYSKAQLNAISRYYTRKAQEYREQELERLRNNDIELYQLFKSSDYKTLHWFMVKFRKLHESIDEMTKLVTRQIRRRARQEEAKRAEYLKCLENYKQASLSDLKLEDITNFLENYKESRDMYLLRKAYGLSWNQVRKILRECRESSTQGRKNNEIL